MNGRGKSLALLRTGKSKELVQAKSENGGDVCSRFLVEGEVLV